MVQGMVVLVNLSRALEKNVAPAAAGESVLQITAGR